MPSLHGRQRCVAALAVPARAAGRSGPRPRPCVPKSRRDALVLSTVLAAPTSTGSWTSSFHPEIDIDGRRTKVLVEQIQAIDPDRRLARKVGHVSGPEQAEIERALQLVLGLF